MMNLFDRNHPVEEVQRLIVAALRDPAGVLNLPPADLDMTLRLMRRARLLGRLAADLQALELLDGLPAVVADQLYGALVVAEARARVGRWELDRIAWALRDVPEVPLVALKGCGYLLAGTPNARGRTFADVDLLVPEADLPSVEAQLRRHGWRSSELTPYDERYYRSWAHEIPPLSHPEREVEVDIHHSILMRTARLKPSSELLFQAARPVAGSRFKVLAPADMVLHAIVHLFYGGEMDDALRELVDIDELLRHFSAREPDFWQALLQRAGRLDLKDPARVGSRYAERLLGCPVPSFVHSGFGKAGPGIGFGRVMDRLVPMVLFPRTLDAGAGWSALARLAFFARSHWLRMRPQVLMPHLLRKGASRAFPRSADR